MAGDVSLDYSELKQWAGSLGVPQHPSEIHGLVAGWICAGSRWRSADRLATLQDWLSVTLADADSELLDRLFDDTLAGLRDDEMGFTLLIPGDDADVNDRTRAVAMWCNGFLAGFGMTGRFQDAELGEDLKEVFNDLSRIASIAEEVPEDEDNEADLIEIAEYVRMSALLVFTECAQRAVH